MSSEDRGVQVEARTLSGEDAGWRMTYCAIVHGPGDVTVTIVSSAPLLADGGEES